MRQRHHLIPKDAISLAWEEWCAPEVPIELVHHFERCESKIEVAFLHAYIELISEKRNLGEPIDWMICETLDEYFGIFDIYPDLVSADVIVLQPRVAGYRPDFVIWRIGPPGFTSPRVAVECDGFQFHDATKALAAKDKQRDRAIQKTGMQILRFTGSEIWKGARSCAVEVYDFLTVALARLSA